MIKLYLDEDVTYILAQALRERGFDVTSAVESGHCGWADEDQLEFAVSENRTILTYNIADFVKIHQKWQALEKKHAGIIISHQFTIDQLGNLIRRTLKFFSIWTPQAIRNQVVFLGR